MEVGSLEPMTAQELPSSSLLGFNGDPQVFAARWSEDGPQALGHETLAGLPRQPRKPARPMRWREAYRAFGLPESRNGGGECRFSPFGVFSPWR